MASKTLNSPSAWRSIGRFCDYLEALEEERREDHREDLTMIRIRGKNTHELIEEIDSFRSYANDDWNNY